MARPTKLSKELEEGYWADVGRSASRRTMRNAYFKWEAMEVLINAGIEKFKYLYDPAKEGTGVKHIRKTVLTELGRIADDEVLLHCAEQLCKADPPPSTAKAVEYIRKVRKQFGSRD